MAAEQPTLYDIDGRTRCELSLYDVGGLVVGAARWWDDEPDSKIGTTRVPQQFEVIIAAALWAPTVHLTVKITKQVPYCSQVLITTDGSIDTEIHAKHLTEIRLRNWIEVAIDNVAREVIPWRSGQLRALQPTPNGKKSARVAIATARSRAKFTPEFLADVANVYRENIDRPVVAVERAYRVRHRTAANYVQRAREAGYLPPTTQGKKQA